MREIINNLREFLICLKSLSKSESIELDDKNNFCVATGVKSESENWVFYDDKDISAAIINQAKDFFDNKNLKFIWPVWREDLNLKFNNLNLLTPDGLMTGMYLDVKNFNAEPEREYYSGGERLAERDGEILNNLQQEINLDVNLNLKQEREDLNNNLKFKILDFNSSKQEIDAWACTAWYGFDDGSNLDEKFLELARELVLNNKIRLVEALLNNKSVGSVLLCEDDLNLGVYYFAVLPEFRRRGIAGLMMNKVLELAVKLGKNKIVLQATQEGEKFYKNFGFQYADRALINLFVN
ncbi:MAG: GNAT family N-acetyltransferase [Synergistaceae bacterium]|nr:GNAT family N-acetyltransferase [Synergistaceae bacterium]